MRSKRTGKEISFKINKFNVKYGTLNVYEPNVIYLRAKARIVPNEDRDYFKSVQAIRRHFLKYVDMIIANDKNLAREHIAQLATNENGLKYNKISIIKFDIYLKPMDNIKFINYLPSVKELSSEFCTQLENILYKNNIIIK